jgi:hypothetical protein
MLGRFIPINNWPHRVTAFLAAGWCAICPTTNWMAQAQTLDNTLAASASAESPNAPAETNAATRDMAEEQLLILVMGEPGTAEYATEFQQWGEAWRELATENGWRLQTVGAITSQPVTSEPTNDENVVPEQTAEVQESEEPAVTAREQLQMTLAQVDGSVRRVWLVMIGHGTYTHGVARFNLTGPDVTPEELSEWVKGIGAELIVINCASASAPFLQALSRPGRIVVTATRSGSEFNYARFGKYFAEAIRSTEADLDHDDSVSLLEAFLAASRKTNAFYVDSARLATEHALLDDNHDRVGTTHDFYRGVRPVKQAQGTGQIDGATAANRILFMAPDAIQLNPAQLQRRETLEAELQQLRSRKESLSIDSYYEQLEQVLLEIARLYETASSEVRGQ